MSPNQATEAATDVLGLPAAILVVRRCYHSQRQPVRRCLARIRSDPFSRAQQNWSLGND
jgi:hypothetical protein